jgi:hypothetical protein
MSNNNEEASDHKPPSRHKVVVDPIFLPAAHETESADAPWHW